MNTVILIGRLTRDPELRYLPGNGQAVTRYSLAVDKNVSKQKRQEMNLAGKSTVDFINIVAWGKQAELCARYLKKGRKAAIRGSIQTGSYTNPKGQKVYKTEVLLEQVEFIDYAENTANSYSNTSASNPSAASNSELPEGFAPIDDDDIPF
jgi:single-strand DNA-binding protein